MSDYHSFRIMNGGSLIINTLGIIICFTKWPLIIYQKWCKNYVKKIPILCSSDHPILLCQLVVKTVSNELQTAFGTHTVSKRAWNVSQNDVNSLTKMVERKRRRKKYGFLSKGSTFCTFTTIRFGSNFSI